MYFGLEKEKTIFFAEHAIGLICKGSTKKFQPEQVLEVMPKMILTLVVDITNESIHHSYKSIRMIVYAHRLFTLLLEKYPSLYTIIDERLRRFIEEPESRVKNVTPSIGDLIVLLTVSKAYKWEHLKEAYLSEQMDRQVFWILKEIPELEKEDGTIIEDARIEASFKITIVGYRITMLLKLLNSEIIEKNGKDFEKLNEYLDARYCRLSDGDEETFKKKINEVFEVKGFFGYYDVIEQHEIPDKDTLNKRLRQAIKNSLEKKYHGEDKKFDEKVKLDEQAQELLHSKPTMLKYWDEKMQKLDKEDDDEFWKKIC